MKFKTLSFSAVLLLLISCTERNRSIYVSPGGSSSNSGTKESPLATFDDAKNLIRALKNENKFPSGGVTVFFREGNYQFAKTLELSPIDSGLGNAPVIYKAFPNEMVSFVGGKFISSNDFTPVVDSNILQSFVESEVKEKILQVDLKKLGIDDYGTFRQHGFSIAVLPAPMELFINKRPMVLARWPNEGIVPITKVIDQGSIPYKKDFSDKGGTIGYNYDRAKFWNNPSDIWLWGYFGTGYADDNLKVEKINLKEKTISLANPSMFGIKKSDPDEEWAGKIVGYYAYNILEEIDMPGEYFIDHQTGILYLYPPEDFKDAEIVVSEMDEPLLAVENTSNIIFENLIFEYGRGMGIYLEGGENVQFRGCVFRNFGTIAAMMGKGVSGADYPIHEFTGTLTSRTVGNLKAHEYENTDFENNAGRNHTFISCDMYNLGSGGMVLSGGDRKTLTPAGNRVENCVIHDYNRRNKTYNAGIRLYGVGNTISHCHIYNAPHQAIALFGNDHVIEYNHIERVVKYVNDQGAIVMGRNPSIRGNVIRFNFFDELGSQDYKNCAIMLDDGTSDFLIEGNVFYKSSHYNFGNITFNGGNDNIVRNNIFIDGSYTIWIEDRKLSMPDSVEFAKTYKRKGLFGKRMYQDIDMNSEIWKNKYPDFDPFYPSGEPKFLKNLEFYNNVIVREKLIVSKHDLDSTAFEVFKNNYRTNENPGFVDYEEKNFNLKDNSVVFEKVPEFKAIPFSKIGVYEDEYRE